MKRALLACCVIIATQTAPVQLALAQPGFHGLQVSPAQVEAVRQYIRHGWELLRRSPKDLYRAAVDPKYPATADPNHPAARGKWPVYIAADENMEAVCRDLRAALPLHDFDLLDLRQLHGVPEREHGVLYLPHPYVVPGGRFNEMYGWDSYFILRGLLRDNRATLARQMTDNLLYEVQHYGMVLNANRSYYLTRSQPPFLSQMVRAVHEEFHDTAWLGRAATLLAQYYRFWNTPPHATATGLARYIDVGHGPAPEVVSGENSPRGGGAYARVASYYRTHTVTDYDVRRFYDAAHNQLTDAFFVGDRSMRESGFDPTNRFGPFSVAIVDYNPVCLNSLLYIMEGDLEAIYTTLEDPNQAAFYAHRKASRSQTMQNLLWDPDAGLFLDYDFTRGARRDYPFATTFFPLWAGMATPEQAQQIVAHLPIFEAPGGIKTSPFVTGNQWDAPYGWAPLQLIAVEGLRRYGYHAEANRLSVAFLSMVVQDFAAHHGIFEKYDVMRRRSDVADGLMFGYSSNEVGFGWTNAVFAELDASLPEAARRTWIAPPPKSD